MRRPIQTVGLIEIQTVEIFFGHSIKLIAKIFRINGAILLDGYFKIYKLLNYNLNILQPQMKLHFKFYVDFDWGWLVQVWGKF